MARFPSSATAFLTRLSPRAALAALVLALAACVSATPYQPAVRGEGYSDQKIERARWRITFAGNAATPRETVENYLLYRAAELTLANGYDHFVMADKSTDKQTTYSQSISAYGGFGRYHWYPAGMIGIGHSTPSTEYVAQADILMKKGAKPRSDAQAFDAREVEENLRGVIVRPEKAD